MWFISDFFYTALFILPAMYTLVLRLLPKLFAL